MSTARSAVAPVRQRGRDRVAAIMDAASAVFAARGFDAATMTEIAAEARTAIGSLYRFFPNKTLLAEAVFARYSDTLLGELDALGARAVGMDAATVADALMSLFSAHQQDRDAAVVLADARQGGALARFGLRTEIRVRIVCILSAATGLTVDAATAMAPMVLQAMKAWQTLIGDGLPRDMVDRETRRMIRAYLDQGMRDGG